MVVTLCGAESRNARIEKEVDVSSELEQAASVFIETRPQLLNIAYRILGSANEGEDVVQEAWLRWQRADRSVIRNAPAFLRTTTTRLALNLAQSARNRREVRYERAILEPVDTGIGPEGRAERCEAVERALWLMLRSLSPAEMSAYILRELFDYPYEEIAAILGLTAVNTRQLLRRARERLGAERHQPVHPGTYCSLVLAFRAAVDGGEFADLECFLADHVMSQAVLSDRCSSPAGPVKRGGPAASDLAAADTEICRQAPLKAA